METLLETIVRGLVVHPHEVKIAQTNDDRGILFEITVHPDDMRNVIGRQGKMADAIRTIMRSVGTREQAHVGVKIIEPATIGKEIAQEAFGAV